MIRKQQWAQGQHPSQGGTTFVTETTSSQLLQNASEKGYTRLRGNTRDSCRSRISLIHKVNRNKFDFKTNLRTRGVEKIYSISVFFKVGVTYRRLACEQALLFGRVKRRVSRERSSERRRGRGKESGHFLVCHATFMPKYGRWEGDYSYNHTEKLIVLVVALLSATKRLWNGKLQIEYFWCLEL